MPKSDTPPLVPVAAKEEVASATDPVLAVAKKFNGEFVLLATHEVEGFKKSYDRSMMTGESNITMQNGVMPFEFEGQTVTFDTDMATNKEHTEFNPRTDEPGLVISSRTSISFTRDGQKRVFAVETYSRDGVEEAKFSEWQHIDDPDSGPQAGPALTDGPDFEMLQRFTEALRTTNEQLAAPDKPELQAAGQVAIEAATTQN